MNRYEIRDNAPGSWYTCHIYDTETPDVIGNYVSRFHAQQILDDLNAPATPEPTTPEENVWESDANSTPEHRAFTNSLAAPARLRNTLALAAIAFLAVTSSALADHTQCYQSGVTGEGFPVISCPAEGTRYYVDMDGTDGTLGTEGDGRWIEIVSDRQS
jgi:hypothetical protein